jgi:hypothetical protein
MTKTIVHQTQVTQAAQQPDKRRNIMFKAATCIAFIIPVFFLTMTGCEEETNPVTPTTTNDNTNDDNNNNTPPPTTATVIVTVKPESGFGTDVSNAEVGRFSDASFQNLIEEKATDASGKATFSNIPPGTYYFQVAKVLSNGNVALGAYDDIDIGQSGDAVEVTAGATKSIEIILYETEISYGSM